MADIDIASAGISAQTNRSRLKAIFGGSVGNLVEWYDWFVYSSFALYFAKEFFPSGDQTAQLLSTAAVFAVGFLVRPIGSWLMGIYCDRHGRRAALVVSMAVMGLGSLAIGITPGYDHIGIFAPILLILARIAQGLSIGGEYAASATYLSEIADRARRGFWGSFQYVTIVMGQLFALVVLIVLQKVLSPEALSSWGWRIPFVVGALCAFAALFIMLELEETKSFEAVRHRTKKANPWKMMAQHPREIAIVLGLSMGGALGFYTFSTYIQKFLANTSGFSKDTATQITAIAMTWFMLMQPVMGWLSDRVGRRPMLIAFGVGATLMTVPVMSLIAGADNAVFATLLVILALTVQSAYTSVSGLYKAELFPTEIRALGVGLPYSIGVSMIGGTAEVVALWLKQQGHESWFYWYVTGFMALCLLTSLLMFDTKKHSKILED